MRNRPLAGPVIITRAEPGNSQTAARLHVQNLPYICAPMLAIAPTGEVLPSLSGVQGILFTSANGVRAFAGQSDRRDLTAWCVGPATLAAAREAEFTDLQHGDGDAGDLARLVETNAKLDTGQLLHVANDAAAGQLAERLRASGFDVIFAPLYKTLPAEALPDAVREALEAKAPARVLIHSAKGAKAFGDLAGKMDLSAHILVAVSQAASAPLAEFDFASTHIAARPNEDALLGALFRTYSAL